MDLVALVDQELICEDQSSSSSRRGKWPLDTWKRSAATKSAWIVSPAVALEVLRVVHAQQLVEHLALAPPSSATTAYRSSTAPLMQKRAGCSVEITCLSAADSNWRVRSQRLTANTRRLAAPSAPQRFCTQNSWPLRLKYASAHLAQLLREDEQEAQVLRQLTLPLVHRRAVRTVRSLARCALGRAQRRHRVLKPAEELVVQMQQMHSRCTSRCTLNSSAAADAPCTFSTTTCSTSSRAGVCRCAWHLLSVLWIVSLPTCRCSTRRTWSRREAF